MYRLMENLMKLFEKNTIVNQIQDLIDIQTDEPTIKTDNYMKGLGNGLVLAKSVITKEEPNWVNNSKKERWFVERTNKHIGLVQKAIEKIISGIEWKEFNENELIEAGKIHDSSKFQEPERIPYIEITWRHKLENEQGKYDPINNKGYQTPGQLDKKDENQATVHHITTNNHHPEYWNKKEANINKSNKCLDATKMSNLAIAEMVADWQAMSWELQKNTAQEWFNKQRNVRWYFSSEQEDLINRLLRVFETRKSYHSLDIHDGIGEDDGW